MTDKELITYLETYRKIYVNGRLKVLKTILANLKPGVKIADYKIEIIANVAKELNAVVDASNAFMAGFVATAYKTALIDTEAVLEAYKAEITRAIDNKTLHNEAVEILVNTINHDVRTGVGVVYKNITTLIDKIVVDNVAESLTVHSVDLAKKTIKQGLIDNSIFSITYKNGRKVSIESYAEMCARSVSREATNKAMVNVMESNDLDLVRITTHSPTCPICATYQGRVYSINPKRTDYPYLYNTAFKSGYNNLHPNCKHVIVPYIDNLYDKSRVAADKEESNKEFVVSDNYMEKENERYKEMVREKRKAYLKRKEKQQKKETDALDIKE